MQVFDFFEVRPQHRELYNTTSHQLIFPKQKHLVVYGIASITAGLGKHLKALTTKKTWPQRTLKFCRLYVAFLEPCQTGFVLLFHGLRETWKITLPKTPWARHFNLMIGWQIGLRFLLGPSALGVFFRCIFTGSFTMNCIFFSNKSFPRFPFGSEVIFHFIHSHKIHNMWYIYLHVPYKS